MKDKLAAAGSLAVTAVLSTCCTLPLLLASLGLGTLTVGEWVRPLRPYMMAAAALLLATGFWRVYGRKSTVQSRALMWGAAVIFAVVVATPYVAGTLRDPGPDPMTLALEPGTRRMVVEVDERAFAVCCESPAQHALDAIPGVVQVLLDHRRRTVVLVVYDDARVSDADVAEALASVGWKGHLQHTPE